MQFTFKTTLGIAAYARQVACVAKDWQLLPELARIAPLLLNNLLPKKATADPTPGLLSDSSYICDIE
jgi:hypothetical protein